MTKTKEIRNYLDMYGMDMNTQDICDAVGCAPRTVQNTRKVYKAEIQATNVILVAGSGTVILPDNLISDESYAVCAEEQAKKKAQDLDEDSTLDYICEGCPKADMEAFKCTVYLEPPGMFLTHRCCPWNRPAVVTTKQRVRVGQQKQNKGM